MHTPYMRTQLYPVIDIDNLVSFHYFEYVKDFMGMEEAHDFWEVVYVDFGAIVAVVNGVEQPLKQGQAIFHQPNEEHNILTCGEFASVIIFSFVCESPAMAFFNGKCLALNAKERDLMADIVREGQRVFEGPFDTLNKPRLTKAAHAPFGGEQMLTTCMTQLLISLIRRDTEALRTASPETWKRQQGEKDIVEQIMVILQENLYGKISLNEISARLSFSVSHLEMVFKKHTGCGIITTLNRLKMTEAKRLISEGEKTYTQIAEMLGFTSIHYFCRTFKKHMSMTPSGYEKSVKLRLLL